MMPTLHSLAKQRSVLLDLTRAAAGGRGKQGELQAIRAGLSTENGLSESLVNAWLAIEGNRNRGTAPMPVKRVGLKKRKSRDRNDCETTQPLMFGISITCVDDQSSPGR